MARPPLDFSKAVSHDFAALVHGGDGRGDQRIEAMIPRVNVCLLCFLLLQPLLLWHWWRTSLCSPTIARWRHLFLQQQQSKQSSMQWRFQGSPPEEVSHASSRVLLAELLLWQALLLWQ